MFEVDNEVEEVEFKKLLVSIWHKIQALELPDVTHFSLDHTGVQQFIEKLNSAD